LTVAVTAMPDVSPLLLKAPEKVDWNCERRS